MVAAYAHLHHSEVRALLKYKNSRCCVRASAHLSSAAARALRPAGIRQDTFMRQLAATTLWLKFSGERALRHRCSRVITERFHGRMNAILAAPLRKVNSVIELSKGVLVRVFPATCSQALVVPESRLRLGLTVNGRVRIRSFGHVEHSAQSTPIQADVDLQFCG